MNLAIISGKGLSKSALRVLVDLRVVNENLSVPGLTSHREQTLKTERKRLETKLTRKVQAAEAARRKKH